MAQDLAHQLGPDGAGGAGDQHGFALDEAGEAVVAEVDGLPAEEVFHADVADLGGSKLPVHPLPNGGHALHFQPNGQGLLGEGLDASSANAFGCQHHALHVVAPHKIVGKRKAGLQNGQAVDGFADFVGVVVDVGHGKALQADVGVNGGLGTSAHAARSKDQNAQPFAGFGAGDEVLEQAANEQPQTYAERQENNGNDHGARQGKLKFGPEKYKGQRPNAGNQSKAQERGLEQPKKIFRAAVAHDPYVGLKEQEAYPKGRYREQVPRHKGVYGQGRIGKLVPDPLGKQVGQRYG